eukprot:TRINITY_DN76915_c0_g1_i1.p1 TRINITY_DN76915_c0_g1~~TRINITY_DN76915_c0_g1_i1.p1  ORF type:complete len:481 (+),score=49.08 TRINITY_DN76915_c0_g1_i1:71-1444(+)
MSHLQKDLSVSHSELNELQEDHAGQEASEAKTFATQKSLFFTALHQGACLDLKSMSARLAYTDSSTDAAATLIADPYNASKVATPRSMSDEVWVIKHPFNDLTPSALYHINKYAGKIHWLSIRYPVSSHAEIFANDFNPEGRFEHLPDWLWDLENLRGLQISFYPHFTLDDNLGHLRKLQLLSMYGSNLQKMPSSIGLLAELRDLNLYTSYRLHYLPYEVVHCGKLRDSTFSTRALYNNSKTRLQLPRLQVSVTEVGLMWEIATEVDTTTTTAEACSTQSCAQKPTSNNSNSRSAVELIERRKARQHNTGDSLTPAMLDYLLQQSFDIIVAARVPGIVTAKIADFIGAEYCSVCGTVYFGPCKNFRWCHTWVATDKQALLVRACSSLCLLNGNVKGGVFKRHCEDMDDIDDEDMDEQTLRDEHEFRERHLAVPGLTRKDMVAALSRRIREIGPKAQQ